jgi:hypothetical protein
MLENGQNRLPPLFSYTAAIAIDHEYNRHHDDRADIESTTIFS